MKRGDTWEGDVPNNCDLCGAEIGQVFVDARINMPCSNRSSWACVCPLCHAEVGVGLGVGYGQKYERAGDKFVLTEGGSNDESYL